MSPAILAAVAFALVATASPPTPHCQPSRDVAVSPDAAAIAAAEAPPVPPVPPADKTHRVKTKSGKTILITSSVPNAATIGNMTVQIAGQASSAIRYTGVDPVTEVLTGDLDGDRYDEIYIITRGAGSGNYGYVFPVASVKDKSLAKIEIPEVEDRDLARGGRLEGYDGNDRFRVSGTTFVREFPVDSPKGKTRTVTYRLKQGKSGYTLEIAGSTVR